MSKIILPYETARKIAEEDAAADRKRKIEVHKRYLNAVAGKLSETVKPISDPEARKAVQQLCRRLIRHQGSRILPHDNPNWEEVGRLVSDVLLGHGYEYERLT